MGPANGPPTIAAYHVRRQCEHSWAVGSSMHRGPISEHGAWGTREVLGVLTSAPKVLPGYSQSTKAAQTHGVEYTRVLGDTQWTRWPPRVHGVLKGYSQGTREAARTGLRRADAGPHAQAEYRSAGWSTSVRCAVLGSHGRADAAVRLP